MLVRRELHTGRYNFLHRSWGPLEPFDESLPEILKEHGVYSHLASDHQHYWEDGGATYHTPLFVWDSRCVAAGEHRGALVQTIDLMPTLLDLFGIKPSKNVEGVGLKETIASDAGDL
jgi:arylsulfatase A-like enzyme